MKADIISMEGQKTSQIEMPKVFETEIRHDILSKINGIETAGRPAYGVNPRAGKETSSSGKIRHRRRKWKSRCQKGISRVPRKIISRRGSSFNWIAAFTPGTRGGRRAHPPKASKIWTTNSMEKEKMFALKCAIALTASKPKNSALEFPIIVENKIEEIKKTKELKNAIKKILGNTKRKILIISEKKIKPAKNLGIENMKVNEMIASRIFSKVVLWTEDAIKEMEKMRW